MATQNKYYYYTYNTNAITTTAATTGTLWTPITTAPVAPKTYDLSAEMLKFWDQALLKRVEGTFLQRHTRPQTMKHMWRPRS